MRFDRRRGVFDAEARAQIAALLPKDADVGAVIARLEQAVRWHLASKQRWRQPTVVKDRFDDMQKLVRRLIKKLRAEQYHSGDPTGWASRTLVRLALIEWQMEQRLNVWKARAHAHKGHGDPDRDLLYFQIIE